MTPRTKLAALVIPAALATLAQAELPSLNQLIDKGFAVAVASYVLIRLEPALKGLTSALTELRVELAKRKEK